MLADRISMFFAAMLAAVLLACVGAFLVVTTIAMLVVAMVCDAVGGTVRAKQGGGGLEALPNSVAGDAGLL